MPVGLDVARWFGVATALTLPPARELPQPVNLEGLRLVPASPARGGRLTFSPWAKQSVGQPGTVLRFTNRETFQRFDVTLDAHGLFPMDFHLEGRLGDRFRVAHVLGGDVGELAAPTENVFDYPLPLPLAEHRGMWDFRELTGPLFGAIRADLTRQGALDDCYLVAALCALAHFRPEAIRDHIEEGVGERRIRAEVARMYGVPADKLARNFGSKMPTPVVVAAYLHGERLGNLPEVRGVSRERLSAAVAHLKARRRKDPILERELVKLESQLDQKAYTVRFFDPDDHGREALVLVDAQLLARPGGDLVYAGMVGGRPDTAEMWLSVSEKAYALWKGAGGYEGIRSGHAAAVLAAILGGTPTREFVSDPDTTWKTLARNVNSLTPTTAATFPRDQAERYANTLIFPSHTYAVMGLQETPGQRFVVLRNIWGNGRVPPGFDELNSTFLLRIEDFCRLFQDLQFTTPLPAKGKA